MGGALIIPLVALLFPILLLLAAINMLFFHFVTYRRAREWHLQAKIPRAGRIAGGVSLLLWIGIVGFGRWIGFV